MIDDTQKGSFLKAHTVERIADQAGNDGNDHARLNFFLASTTAALQATPQSPGNKMVRLHPMNAPLLKRQWNFRTVRDLKMQAIACGGHFE